MQRILNTYDSISLEEMKKVRLMNRIDTKYVTTVSLLTSLLKEAREFYYVQVIENQNVMPYYTLYYDTVNVDMYMEHLRGRKRRQKIRIRRYEASGMSFLEVKNKNNKGRTKKIRMSLEADKDNDFNGFIGLYGNYPLCELAETIENRFSRITLVNRNLTERLTIDIHLRFHNLSNHRTCLLEDLVIIELKRDGKNHSPVLDILRRLHIHEAKFSKYCMGMVLTNEQLKCNRFKPRIRMTRQMCNIVKDIIF
ncbi:MAG: VTC domain-containing protein [Bacteroidaceae bacterium]|nr:VTC domain-containing protein [Bacteroidaceae bacterium]